MFLWLVTLSAAALFTIPILGAQLRIGAAASLSESLTEAARHFEKTHSDRIRINFASSSLIARQIQEGARMDLFFSADSRSMDQVESELEPGTRRDFLSNRLALVCGKDESLSVTNLAELPIAKIKRIALGDPVAVPAGLYARQALQDAGVWALLEKKILPCENVRGALAAVEAGNSELAIVYRTDAKMSKKVRILCVIEDPQVRIVYPIAVLKGSSQKASARGFLDFLLSQEGKDIFMRHGFSTLP